jgi:hypothetical protein
VYREASSIKEAAVEGQGVRSKMGEVKFCWKPKEIRRISQPFVRKDKGPEQSREPLNSRA